jgi:hypothetical protein
VCVTKPVGRGSELVAIFFPNAKLILIETRFAVFFPECRPDHEHLKGFSSGCSGQRNSGYNTNAFHCSKKNTNAIL